MKKFHFVIKHQIPFEASWVFQHLNETLFEELLPPRWIAEPLRNDGVEVGDEIWMNMKFPLRGIWKTKIIHRVQSEQQYWFTDAADIQLPKGMVQWIHIHRVKEINQNSSVIEEDITWIANNWLIGSILNFIFMIEMKMRYRSYKKYFKKISIGA
jgi:ligand-binding SRPBCC domain-containing protein